VTQTLALFDFDGTITTVDTFTPFVRQCAGRWRKLFGALALSPLIAAYKLRLIGGSPLRRAIAYLCFRGRNAEEVHRLGRQYGATLHSRARAEMLERIRVHRASGDTVVVVSASLAVYLEDFCRGVGAEVIATELEARGGVLTGRYLNGDCTGEEKARRVRERYDLARYDLIVAYGDTAEDEALLRLAARRFFRGRELTLPAPSASS
jgi:HAD superfamily hydrolase (TIGR01490 family)